MIFVEPSMQLGGDFSIENPGDQDPSMIELVQAEECAEAIIQHYLDNPKHTCDPSYSCCNRCDPSMKPGREYQWLEDNPGPSSTFPAAKRSTNAQRELIYDKLGAWRLQHWRSDWKARWPSYGPKTLISDSDLEELAPHTNKITCIEDMRRYTHIVHWTDLSTPLFETLQGICQELNLVPPAPEVVIDEPTVNQPPQKRRKTTGRRKPEELAQGEMIIDF
jgi:hypothetical protein